MTEYWDGTGVSVQALKAEIIRLGEEFPKRTTFCVYSNGDKPVCIVGQAVFNITGKLVDEAGWTDRTHAAIWVKELGGDPDRHRYGFSEEDYRAWGFTYRAQINQDSGLPWGEAVKKAAM